jgi:hypothetical protein
LADCPEKSSTEKYKCSKHKERCCHSHSTDEKKLCTEVLESLVPKVLPQKEDIMQYYLEMLPDYQPTPGSSKPIVDHNNYEDDQYAAVDNDN